MKRIIPLLALLGLSACAAITTGTSQAVTVDTTPPGAACTLVNDKGSWAVPRTPGSVTVQRSYSALSVSCDKGRLKGVTTVQSGTKGAAFGNILVGGIVGAAVDMSSGAAYDYPATVHVGLGR